jgi:hypothetical protein
VAPVAGPVRPSDERPEVLVAEGPSEERKKVLAARRRLLGMLLALAVGSGVLAVAKMAAWWVIVPPFIMLTGYLGLLREASKVDAERRELAHARAAEAATEQAAPPATVTAPAVGQAPAAGAAAAAAPAAPVAPPLVPDAEVIDISASVSQGGKEFYDQYTDAKLRAVGDLPHPAAA